ncbi:MAG: helix-turn-helix domain-containing protein, partial [Bacteroidetes bacterium]|nr:helix-turn-helix domain-containing protein [Bacteroidota bacterium]
MTGTLTMSATERKTLLIVQQHIGGYLTAQEAARELSISERQFYRIKRRYLDEG